MHSDRAMRDTNPEIYLRKVRENIAKKQGHRDYEEVARQRGEAAVARAEAEFTEKTDTKVNYERKRKNE